MSEPDFNDPVFLRTQLELAFASIRRRDEYAAQNAARLEANYAEKHKYIEESRQHFKDLEREVRQVALRYSLLRMHQVRVRSLGLLGKGARLDDALDGILAQMGVPALKKLSIVAGVHAALEVSKAH